MAIENKVIAGNGPDQRFEKLETALRARDDAQPSEQEFTLARLGDFLAQHGREQQAATREFAQQLLETERRKLAYLEAIVGKLVK